MTHGQWQVKVRKSPALGDRDPPRAVKSLNSLVSRLQLEATKNVGDWHVEQTLEAVSILQSRFGDHQRSAATILQVAERHEHQLQYYKRALVAACATAALEL